VKSLQANMLGDDLGLHRSCMNVGNTGCGGGLPVLNGCLHIFRLAKVLVLQTSGLQPGVPEYILRNRLNLELAPNLEDSSGN
jgi:hypothetical protein